ncbi:MAG: hypothetical protein J7J06_02605, partial [Methanosarcinales archaeon]|nr:hypothetical protein [Methanosarcinales archaeon]
MASRKGGGSGVGGASTIARMSYPKPTPTPGRLMQPQQESLPLEKVIYYHNKGNRMNNILKRDGRITNFKKEKITTAIH